MKQTIHYVITILLLIGVLYLVYANNELESEMEGVSQIALKNNDSDINELEIRVSEIEDNIESIGAVLKKVISDVSNLDSDIDDLEFELQMIKNQINY